MYRVALTGGIASGKSAVSNEFSRLGVPVIDADVSARTVVEPNTEGLQALVSLFGPSILNAEQNLDRARLRQLIFTDEKARAQVNALLHPLIRTDMDKQALRSSSAYSLFVIPLLFESGQQREYDQVLLVESALQLRIERLMHRDHIDEIQAQAMLDAQASDAQRQTIATQRINNDGTLADLRSHVAELHRLFLDLATWRS